MMKIEFVSEVFDNYSPLRIIKLYRVKDEATSATLFGPAEYKACIAWRRDNPPVNARKSRRGVKVR